MECLAIYPNNVAILISQWLMNLVVVQPEVVKAEDFGLPVLEVGGTLFLGGFALTIYAHGRANLMVSLTDPLLRKYLDEKDHH